MSRPTVRDLLLVLVVVSGALGAFASRVVAAAADAPAALRLYALDCGSIEFHDLSPFSDTGEYDGKSGSIAVPCFLIRHPKGTLLWDTGLDPAAPPSPDNAPVRMRAGVPLTQQLARIGVRPADVTLVAFSHLHGDHTGGANAFGGATWILNRTELAWALGKPAPFAVQPATFSAYKTAHTRIIDSDLDVFGDGTVRILQTPGHTPGHQVLMLRLRTAGVVLLSGDLYHLRSDRAQRLLTIFNTNRAETLASFDRFERIARRTHARVIIQHDPQDFAALPRYPAFLE